MSVKILERKKLIWDKKFNGLKVAKDPFGMTVEFDKFNRKENGGWAIDHIWPTSKGGSNSPENMQVISYKANLKKKNDLEGTFQSKQFKVCEIKKINGSRIGNMKVWNKEKEK